MDENLKSRFQTGAKFRKLFLTSQLNFEKLLHDSIFVNIKNESGKSLLWAVFNLAQYLISTYKQIAGYLNIRVLLIPSSKTTKKD